MKGNFNPEFYIKPQHPSSMKVKKGVFLQTFKKLYVYTSYVLFLKEDIFEHNKEVKVDVGFKKQEIREENYAGFLENNSSEL